MKKDGAFQDSISLFLKFILLLIFPLQIYGLTINNTFILPTTGLLFSPIQSNPSVFQAEYTVLDSTGLLRNFLVGLLVALPGIFFTYKIARAPVNKSYWKRGLGAGAGLYGLVFALMMFLSLQMAIPSGYFDWALYEFMSKVRFYATLVFAVFILLPLVQRQAVIIGSPTHLHDYSMKDLESSPKLSLTREKILSNILWLSLCFGPYAIGGNPNYWTGLPLSSLMMSYYTGGMRGIEFDIFYYQASVQVADFTFFPFVAIPCIFQFMFVRDIYRYLRKSITRQRLVGMAVLSAFSPLFLSTSLIPIIFYYYVMALVPIPVLQVVGFLAVKFHRPLADQVDRVWEDDEKVMWWESPRKKREPAVITTPEKPNRHHDEEVITIPMNYLLISRLRQLNRRGK